MSSVSLNKSNTENKNYLSKALFLITLIATPVLLFFCLFPHTVILLLLGEAYTSYTSLLPTVSFYLFFAAYANIGVYYLVALNTPRLTSLMLSFLAILSFLLFFFADSIHLVIYIFMIVSILIAMTTLCIAYLPMRHFTKT